MSYAFDVLSRAWRERERLALGHDAGLKVEMLIDTMHQANHRLLEALSEDRRVLAAARAVEAALGR